jgi:hypothetical protein
MCNTNSLVIYTFAHVSRHLLFKFKRNTTNLQNHQQKYMSYTISPIMNIAAQITYSNREMYSTYYVEEK